MQDVRDGAAATKAFHKVMQSLVSTMRKDKLDPSSIAAHLLDIKDPSTGIVSFSARPLLFPRNWVCSLRNVLPAYTEGLHQNTKLRHDVQAKL